MVAEPLSDEEQMNAFVQGWRSNNLTTNLLWDCYARAPDKARGYGDIKFTNVFVDDSTMHHGSGVLDTDTARLNAMGFRSRVVIPDQSK